MTEQFLYVFICDVIKQNESDSIFVFLIDCMYHLQSYLLEQTLLKLVNWFQRYRQLKDLKKKQNKTKQKKQ